MKIIEIDIPNQSRKQDIINKLREVGVSEKELKNVIPNIVGYYSLKKCQDSAKKYQTRHAWEKGDRRCYWTAVKHGWLDICCKHMDFVYKNRTLEQCMMSAKKYKTKKEWEKSPNSEDRKCYGYARRRADWYKACCSHMNNNQLRPVLCLGTGEIFTSATEASIFINRSIGIISKCIKNNWKAGGYYWKYLDQK